MAFEGWVGSKSEVGMSQASLAHSPGAARSRCKASGLIVLFISRLQSDSLDKISLGKYSPVSTLIYAPLTKQSRTKTKQMLIMIKSHNS